MNGRIRDLKDGGTFMLQLAGVLYKIKQVAQDVSTACRTEGHTEFLLFPFSLTLCDMDTIFSNK